MCIFNCPAVTRTVLLLCAPEDLVNMLPLSKSVNERCHGLPDLAKLLHDGRYLSRLNWEWVDQRAKFFRENFISSFTDVEGLISDNKVLYSVCPTCHRRSQVFTDPDLFFDDGKGVKICPPCDRRVRTAPIHRFHLKHDPTGHVERWIREFREEKAKNAGQHEVNKHAVEAEPVCDDLEAHVKKMKKLGRALACGGSSTEFDLLRVRVAFGFV